MNLLSAAKNALKMRTGHPFGDSIDPHEVAINQVLNHYILLHGYLDDWLKRYDCHGGENCEGCAWCDMNDIRLSSSRQ